MADNKYEGFTLSLALVDAIPVLAFGGSCILLGMIFNSPLFIAGACCTFLGGAMKVLWKIILATAKKDIVFLNKQFRYMMIGGFVIIIISLIVNRSNVKASGIGASLFSMPSLLFVIIWVCGMVAMSVLAKKLDPKVAKNNWIEQCVNGAAQLSLFTALLLIIL